MRAPGRVMCRVDTPDGPALVDPDGPADLAVMLWWAESVKGSQEYLSGVIATLRMAGTTWARIAEYLGEPRRTVQDRYGWCDDLELLADMGLLEQLHDAVEDINSRRAPDDLRIPSPRVAS